MKKPTMDELIAFLKKRLRRHRFEMNEICLKYKEPIFKMEPEDESLYKWLKSAMEETECTLNFLGEDYEH